MAGNSGAGTAPSLTALILQMSVPARPVTFAQEQGEPALAPVGRRIVDPRSVTATRIEQDRIFEFLLERILVRRVNVVDHDASFRPARTVRIASIIGGAEDGFAARFEAALPCDVERRLGRRRCVGEGEGGDHETTHAMFPGKEAYGSSASGSPGAH